MLGLVTTLAWRSHRENEHQRLVVSLAADPPKMAAAVQSGEVNSHEANAAVLKSETQRFEERVRGYFALPAGKPRQDYLDRVIDRVQKEIQSAKAQHAAMQEPTTHPSRQEVVGLIEEMSPALKAQMAEFMRAMVERIKQRGISLPGQ